MSKTTSQAISLSVQDGQPSIELNLGIPMRNGVEDPFLIISDEQMALFSLLFYSSRPWIVRCTAETLACSSMDRQRASSPRVKRQDLLGEIRRNHLRISDVNVRAIPSDLVDHLFA